MNGLLKELDLVPSLSQLFEPMFNPSQCVQSAHFNVDVYEKDDSWVVEAALPGVSKDEIFIDISSGILEISIEKKQTKRKANANYVVSELSYGKSARAFKLPRGIDSEVPSAQLIDGILTLTFEKSKQNKIEIKIK